MRFQVLFLKICNTDQVIDFLDENSVATDRADPSHVSMGCFSCTGEKTESSAVGFRMKNHVSNNRESVVGRSVQILPKSLLDDFSFDTGDDLLPDRENLKNGWFEGSISTNHVKLFFDSMFRVGNLTTCGGKEYDLSTEEELSTTLKETSSKISQNCVESGSDERCPASTAGNVGTIVTSTVSADVSCNEMDKTDDVVDLEENLELCEKKQFETEVQPEPVPSCNVQVTANNGDAVCDTTKNGMEKKNSFDELTKENVGGQPLAHKTKKKVKLRNPWSSFRKHWRRNSKNKSEVVSRP